jgi:DNA polymerase I-like protein with 3'-5' exonuclease and polymerase domains
MSEVDKQIVVAPQGQVIASFDLSGIELRVAASLSHDKNLIDIINSGLDPYRLVAERAYHIPYKDIAKKSQERSLGKEAVLAFIFEAMPYTMQAQVRNRTQGALQVPDEDAQKLYDAWWSLAPDLKAWSHDNWVRGCLDGFYATAMGRRRRFNMEDYREELSKKEKWGKTLWKPTSLTTTKGEMYQVPDALFRASCPKYKRLCSNHIVQSTAGEGFKLGVSRMPFREYGWGVIGFIHDANDLLINETDTSWAVDFIPKTMLQSMAEVLHNAGGAPIALGVEGTIGKCWAKFNKERAKEYVVPDDTEGWYQSHLGEWKLHDGNFTRIS